MQFFRLDIPPTAFFAKDSSIPNRSESLLLIPSDEKTTPCLGFKTSHLPNSPFSFSSGSGFP
jgi:hypothetical protein